MDVEILVSREISAGVVKWKMYGIIVRLGWIVRWVVEGRNSGVQDGVEYSRGCWVSGWDKIFVEEGVSEGTR